VIFNNCLAVIFVLAAHRPASDGGAATVRAFTNTPAHGRVSGPGRVGGVVEGRGGCVGRIFITLSIEMIAVAAGEARAATQPEIGRSNAQHMSLDG